MIHSTIILTASGVSRCVSTEANATVGFIPALLGLGGALALDAPITIEACGTGRPALIEELDVKITGRGLYYSSPSLENELIEYITNMYTYEPGIIGYSSEYNKPYTNHALAHVALKGSRIFINNYSIPLYGLKGYWAVVVRLEKPFNNVVDHIVVDMATNYYKYLELLIETIVNPLHGLYKLGVHTASVIGRRALRLVKMLEKKGATVALLDYTGQLALAIVSDSVEASLLSEDLREIGSRLEAQIIA